VINLEQIANDVTDKGVVDPCIWGLQGAKTISQNGSAQGEGPERYRMETNNQGNLFRMRANASIKIDQL
jgi:hypothetical protein